MTQKTNQKGFTLIELLITIAIVAILATIALPAYSVYKDRAKYAEVVHAVEPLKTAIDVCIQTSNATTVAALVTACSAVTASGSDSAASVASVAPSANGAVGIRITATAANDATIWQNNGDVGGTAFVIEGTPTTGPNVVAWAVIEDVTVSTCKAVGVC